MPLPRPTAVRLPTLLALALGSAAAVRAGAFALPAGSKDAAVLATLPAGVYTIQVSADSTSSGSALLEIYEIP